MKIQIVEFYPSDIEKLNSIDIEKCKWFLSKLRDKYSEELIRMAIESLQEEEFKK